MNYVNGNYFIFIVLSTRVVIWPKQKADLMHLIKNKVDFSSITKPSSYNVSQRGTV